MYKKIYDKDNPKSALVVEGLPTLKDLMKCVLPNSKIKWVGEKRTYKCIARSDNFIIVNKPFNLRKDYDGSPIVQYSIFDLTQMKCNRDNLVFGIYDYSNKDSCEEALKCLERNLIPFEERYEEIDPDEDGRRQWKPKYDGADDVLEISQRGIANIEDVIEEIWVEVRVKR